MLYKASYLILFPLVLGCATPHVVQPVRFTDQGMSCNLLELEMAEADRYRVAAQGEKGVTGTNVAAFLFFWPAIFGTYSNANEAIAAADTRKAHLANIHVQKKCNDRSTLASLTSPTGTGSTAVPRNVEQRLVNLKDLLDKGLITLDDYKQTRTRIISEL